jgi:hypothetical protein
MGANAVELVGIAASAEGHAPGPISPDPALKGSAMYSSADVPEEYRQLFFVNAGGPSRNVLSREVVQKKWQLVTLDCSHRILVPKYQKSAKVGCGFCGGLDPLSQP